MLVLKARDLYCPWLHSFQVLEKEGGIVKKQFVGKVQSKELKLFSLLATLR